MCLIKIQLANVLESLGIIADVFKLRLEVPVVLLVLLGEEECMLVVASGSAHLDGSLDIEVDFSVFSLRMSSKVRR